MKHQGKELYIVCINHDLWMTLTYFTARSTYVANAFQWGKKEKMSFLAENLLEMSKWAEYLCRFAPDAPLLIKLQETLFNFCFRTTINISYFSYFDKHECPVKPI